MYIGQIGYDFSIEYVQIQVNSTNASKHFSESLARVDYDEPPFGPYFLLLQEHLNYLGRCSSLGFATEFVTYRRVESNVTSVKPILVVCVYSLGMHY